MRGTVAVTTARPERNICPWGGDIHGMCLIERSILTLGCGSLPAGVLDGSFFRLLVGLLRCSLYTRRQDRSRRKCWYWCAIAAIHAPQPVALLIHRLVVPADNAL
jgi:hypothetical protein